MDPFAARLRYDLNASYIYVHFISSVNSDDGDNHDKGNDNGSPTDTKMTGQKDLTE